MGTSTNAILVYGVALHDFDEEQFHALPFSDGDEDDDFDSFIARRAGIPTRGEEGYDYKNIMAATEAYPLSLVSHCSLEYPCWVLGVKATEKTAHRGHPVLLGGSLPKIPNDGVRELKAVCEEFGIEFVPDWVLCSNWA